MSITKRWSVDISIEEQPDQRRTHARARLDGDGTHLAGVGTAQRFPRDRDLPAIGDELAAARALADLSRQLTSAAIADMDSAGRIRSDEG